MYQAFFKTLILNSMYYLARVFITVRTKCTLLGELHTAHAKAAVIKLDNRTMEKDKCTRLF